MSTIPKRLIYLANLLMKGEGVKKSQNSVNVKFMDAPLLYGIPGLLLNNKVVRAGILFVMPRMLFII